MLENLLPNSQEEQRSGKKHDISKTERKKEIQERCDAVVRVQPTQLHQEKQQQEGWLTKVTKQILKQPLAFLPRPPNPSIE